MTPILMTRREYHKIHPDFRGTIRPAVLQDVPGRGTCLVPVLIVDGPEAIGTRVRFKDAPDWPPGTVVAVGRWCWTVRFDDKSVTTVDRDHFEVLAR